MVGVRRYLCSRAARGFSPQTVSSSGRGRSESPVYTNLQELKITQSALPPAPAGSPLHILGDWETHKDQNGRHFYYNRSTQERTWKPPRAKDASTGSSRHDSQSAGESSEVQTLNVPSISIPSGLHTLVQLAVEGHLNHCRCSDES